MSKEQNKLELIKQLCKQLRLSEMSNEIAALAEDPEAQGLAHVDWFLEALEREAAKRRSNALMRRFKEACLRHPQANETNIDFDKSRGLSRSRIMSLMTCQWVKLGQNCLIVGKVGVGKTWMACALGNACCRAGMSVKMIRVPQLMLDIQFKKELNANPFELRDELMRFDLLILDDWGMGPVTASVRSFLNELLDARYQKASTMVTSVLPIDKWSQWIDDATFADSIMDRLVTNAHVINIDGESMRKQAGNGTVSCSNKKMDTSELPKQKAPASPYEEMKATTRQKVCMIMQDCLDNKKPYPTIRQLHNMLGRGSWSTITSARKQWQIEHNLWNPPAYTQK